MIVKVKKYLFFGAKEDLNLFYERAQIAGFIEFLSPSKKSRPLPDEIRILLSAIKFLGMLPPSPPIPRESSEIFSDAKEVLSLRERQMQLAEEKRIVETEKAIVAPFGDFSREDLRYIEANGHRKIQFFCAKPDKVGDLLLQPDLIPVASQSGLEYFLSISSKITNYPALTEIRPEYTPKEAEEKLLRIQEESKTIDAKLQKFSRYLESFRQELLSVMDAEHLACAKADAALPEEGVSVFCSEGWVPDTKVGLLVDLFKDLAVYAEQVAVDPEDKVPTAMENKGNGRIGEDLVCFYDAPAVGDTDPSKWVFWSFALFFSIIIADGGYGLLFLALAAYLKKKKGTFYGSTKRMFRLFVTLSSCVVIWGCVTSSFFGLDLASDNPLKKLAPFTYLVEKKTEYHMEQKDDVYQEYVKFCPEATSANSPQAFLRACPEAGKDFASDILLDITIIIGIVHIACSLLRYGRRNFPAFGWTCFLAGAYLFFPKMLEATTVLNFLGCIDKVSANRIGEVLVYGGFGLAVVAGVIQKRLKGLLEIMNVIQLGADVLSYLRLYALALASSIMAGTFNNMGESAGIAGGFLIILAGHVTNLGLGTMSGVIHGLRLNFIEWYRYSFEGGGRLFHPLGLLRSKEE